MIYPTRELGRELDFTLELPKEHSIKFVDTKLFFMMDLNLLLYAT